MLFNKNGRKMRHPYAKLAILGLAATGAWSIVSKTKQFAKEKINSISSVVKGTRYE